MSTQIVQKHDQVETGFIHLTPNIALPAIGVKRGKKVLWLAFNDVDHLDRVIAFLQVSREQIWGKPRKKKK